jgi:hypothetical protein
MERALVTLVSSASRTRVLVKVGPDELLRANLPPLSRVRHERAAKAYRKVLLLLPEHPEARTGLARSLERLGFPAG